MYAIGSLTGELTSDMVSQEEGKIAAEHAMGKKRQLNREWVPQIARLFPSVAHVGCSMKTAPLQGFHPIEGLFEEDFNDSENFLVPKGEKYKVVVDKRSRLIVGAQIISHQASDWMPMLLLLIKKGMTVGNLANSISSEGSKISGLCEAAKNCLKALKSQ